MTAINNTTASIKLATLAVLTALILVSAVLYSSSLVAAQQATVQQEAKTEAKQSNQFTERLAMLQSYEYRTQPKQTEAEQPEATLKDILLPVGTWFLGSALLAMVGYKRMRNSVTGTD